METLENLTLAKIVSLRPEAAPLFEKYNLDFCCRGKQTLSAAIPDDLEKLEFIRKKLLEIFSKEESETKTDFESLPLSRLIEYILDNHHRYVKEALPVIYEHVQKISSKHGEKHPELKRIEVLFAEIKNEMEQHMLKEETILFPGILRMEFTINSNPETGGRLMLEGPIHVMESEHEFVGNAMQEIRKLSSDYSPPESACTTYRLAFDELKRFESDLHQHVHLENNILFPKAIDMQKKSAGSIVN